MKWNAQLGISEWLFIISFIVVYVLYYLKVLKTSKVLNSRLRNFEFKFFLRSFILTLLIVSILGPIFGASDENVDKLNNASDIYFAFDLSESMNLNDLEPSRLNKLKFELLKIIPKLNNNKIGLIVFTEQAFQILPLTFDETKVIEEIKSLNSDIFKYKGTVLDSPLLLLDNKYQETNEKLINLIVFTDGENFGVFNEQLPNLLKNKNIKVRFFGVGTAKGKLIPESISNRNNVLSNLKTNFLKELNAQFDSNYYELTNSNNDLEELIFELNNSSSWGQNSRNYNSMENRYTYFLLLAIGLICLDLLWVNKTMKF